MRFLLLTSALSASLWSIGRGLHTNGIDRRIPVSSVEEFIEFETPVAHHGLYANIGPDGERSSGAHAGVVIASPSTEDPDYLFTWIRDSALVFKVVVDSYVTGRDQSVLQKIEQWVLSMAKIQGIPNPSGNVDTGGLGEPKFEIDETAFTGDWGRPQRDGPALRATSIITFANHLLSQNNVTFVKQTLWPVIKLDLDYVSNVWNLTGFDLWEEVAGASFFTTAAQHRALREGVALASALGEDSGDWTTQADNALCLLHSYWTPEDNYIVANVNSGGRIRSGLDSNTILASIHTFDPAAGCDATTFQPCSDKALANLKRYVDAFRSGVYPINNGIPADKAVALGRYTEDVYYNGNPWYLTTLAVTEQLYRAVHTWEASNSGIEVTSISLSFFQQFLPSLSGPTTIAKDSQEFSTIISGVKGFADGFILIVAQYTPENGQLDEQYTKENGTPISAKHLTWSYAAALTAFEARANTEVKSWGASGLQVPSVCGTNPGPQASLTFTVEADTSFGENIFVTGNLDAIANWSPQQAIALNYQGPRKWSVTISVPASTNFAYKYIKKDGNGNVVWESDPNRSGTTPAKDQSGNVEDVWR